MGEELKSSICGRLLARTYKRLPGRRFFLRLVVRLEGGEMRSSCLRRVLRHHHGVEAGAHSYGSLLRPGFADRGLTIGRYVSVGPNVRRFGAAHPVSELSMHPYWYKQSFGFVDEAADVLRTDCRIDDDCWIGANVTILPGCTRIGLGAVIGAGSVVTKDVDDFMIVAGNPAKMIGSRLSESDRDALRSERPYDLPPEGVALFMAGRRSRPDVS